VYLPLQDPSDATKALDFARTSNISLVVKNSGHDYKGRSSAPGSLALWTFPYQKPITLTKNFTPAGCSAPVGMYFTEFVSFSFPICVADTSRGRSYCDSGPTMAGCIRVRRSKQHYSSRGLK
jgi:hypothetical protein